MIDRREESRRESRGKRTWNGTPPGSVGTFEAYLRLLSAVLGLAFGAFGGWSKEAGILIGQLAEVASEVPVVSVPAAKLQPLFSSPALWPLHGRPDRS